MDSSLGLAQAARANIALASIIKAILVPLILDSPFSRKVFFFRTRYDALSVLTLYKLPFRPLVFLDFRSVVIEKANIVCEIGSDIVICR